MPKIMNMPKIGVNMTEAKIVEWVVKEGDTIKEGDHILDAETDKAVQEIYTTMSGVVSKILVTPGTEVLCQSPIAVLVEPGEKPENGDSQDNSEKKEQAVTVSSRKRISPLAKKIAGNMSIPIEELAPSKPGSRITKADVLAYAVRRNSINAASQTTLAYAGTTVTPSTQTTAHVATTHTSNTRSAIPYTGIRKLIGDRMTESTQTKPSVALTLHADAGRLIEWREKLKKSGKSVSYNDMLVLIAAKALNEQPIINSRLEGSEIKLLQDINVGVAVDTEKGLVVPVIRNADKKGLLEISEDFRMKVEAVKSGKAGVGDLSGGTFTITNLGMYEIENFSPIINPPECCILAVGAIVREPAVDENDTIMIKSRMQLTLVFDHRIVDGAPAAKFLQRVKHLVEWPLDLSC